MPGRCLSSNEFQPGLEIIWEVLPEVAIGSNRASPVVVQFVISTFNLESFIFRELMSTTKRAFCADVIARAS